MERGLATGQLFEAAAIRFHRHHGVPDVGEAGGYDGAHIATPDNCDALAHHLSFKGLGELSNL